MPHEIRTASIQGIEAVSVSAQIDSSPGIHTLSIVGLGDRAVQESQERINAAVRNSGFKPPSSQNRKYTINLEPADLKKEGVGFDLPVAVAYLLDSKQISVRSHETLLFGGLSLDGSLARTNGVITAALLARNVGIQEIIVPWENAQEAAFIDGIRVIGSRSLQEVARHLSGEAPLEPVESVDDSPREPTDAFLYVSGQETAKRALIVAAAGGHNVLMKGPPGAGKTLLAKSIVSILPPLQEQEMLELARIYSAVGLLATSPRALGRPFRNPHHTASAVSIIGGGASPRPGEVSLAHRGVLFLDEFAEFPRNVLESLRQPLEDGVVTIARASGTITLPAQFLLIASMNPCPCGNHGDMRLPCSCAPQQVARYAKKISGPLLDRMDVQITVARESVPTGVTKPGISELLEIRERIRMAREHQARRLSQERLVTNSDMGHRNIEELCLVQPSALSLLKSAINQKNLSFRTYHRTLKVARTIADLEDEDHVQDPHIAEALSLRIDGTAGN